MATAIVSTPKRSVLEKFGQQYDLDASKVIQIVSDTVFRASKPEDKLSNEEVAAALIVCNQYNLNPFTKEIYAFRSKGKLLIIVGIDGWSAIVNRQEALDGIEFDENFDADGRIESVTCRIFRKDRKLPTVVTEYWRECKRDTEPWRNMPIRMTRNRSFAQCARIAFSIGGIIDEDEAQTIEGYPAQGPVVDQTVPKWTEDQIVEIESAISDLKWSGTRQASFRSQYAGRPTEALTFLKKEVEKLKRVTPKAEKQEPKKEPEPEPQQDAEPEPQEEKAVEW